MVFVFHVGPWLTSVSPIHTMAGVRVQGVLLTSQRFDGGLAQAGWAVDEGARKWACGRSAVPPATPAPSFSRRSLLPANVGCGPALGLQSQAQLRLARFRLLRRSPTRRAGPAATCRRKALALFTQSRSPGKLTLYGLWLGRQ